MKNVIIAIFFLVIVALLLIFWFKSKQSKQDVVVDSGAKIADTASGVSAELTANKNSKILIGTSSKNSKIGL